MHGLARLTRACLALFALIAIAGVAGELVAQAQPAVPPARAAGKATHHDNARLGYGLDLPGNGWRRSDALSLDVAGDPLHLGHEVFTARTPDEERAALDVSHELGGPAWQYAVVVEAYKNAAGLTPLQWATSTSLSGWSSGQQVSAATLGGRDAVLVRNGARYSVAYYVRNGEEMLLIGYDVPATASASSFGPAGETRGDLEAIVRSLRAYR